MRILVTRTDRLGDVILATPVLRRLRESDPEARISFLVRKSWMPVLAFGDDIELIPFDPEEPVPALSERLKAGSFDIAYVLKDEKSVSWAVKKAGIPVRSGPYSTLRSFLLFNEGRFQRRSRCLMHEAEYNLDLVSRVAPADSPSDLPGAWVATSPMAAVRAQDFLNRSGLGQKSFVVIHPGSSGSARYVRPEKLHGLASGLLRRGLAVVVSGGPLETGLLQEFKKAVPGVILLGPAEGLELDGLAEVYRRARVVAAHGTGPLHLAAAVGTAVFAVFPPLFVLSEKRWGPLTGKRSVWVPDVECPEKYRCRGPRCGYFDCMDRFEIEAAADRVEELCS
jgi:heptosyltransferase-3